MIRLEAVIDLLRALPEDEQEAFAAGIEAILVPSESLLTDPQ